LDEWAEIRRLHRSEGLGIKAVARKLGISKNTVRRALRAEEVPRYQRAPKGSISDAAGPAIREQLALCATMPATVIAERIGWDRSITVLREKVAQLRPESPRVLWRLLIHGRVGRWEQHGSIRTSCVTGRSGWCWTW